MSGALEGVSYTPVVSVTAFVLAAACTRPVRGVGVLVPAGERRECLGVLFNSSAFEGRVYDESRFSSFTVLLGGTAQPGWASASDEEIERAVISELDALLGVKGRPAQLIINRWPRAIPQYSTSLPRVWQRARETWCATPGHPLRQLHRPGLPARHDRERGGHVRGKGKGKRERGRGKGERRR